MERQSETLTLAEISGEENDGHLTQRADNRIPATPSTKSHRSKDLLWDEHSHHQELQFKQTDLVDNIVSGLNCAMVSGVSSVGVMVISSPTRTQQIDQKNGF